MQRGSAQLLLLVLVLAGVLGIFIYLNQSKSQVSVSPNNPIINKVTSTLSNEQTYSNKESNFEFKYTNPQVVKEDSEESFNQRTTGGTVKSVEDFRKNFKGYVQYNPGKFLAGVVVLEKDNYDTNPFTLWIFDNPDDLSIDAWYKNYWYYPFVWGDFTYKGKFELVPKEEATISGQMAKTGIIDYQPGKPRFVYLSKDQKMYLFRIIGEQGEKILSTFKFTN